MTSRFAHKCVLVILTIDLLSPLLLLQFGTGHKEDNRIQLQRLPWCFPVINIIKIIISIINIRLTSMLYLSLASLLSIKAGIQGKKHPRIQQRIPDLLRLSAFL